MILTDRRAVWWAVIALLLPASSVFGQSITSSPVASPMAAPVPIDNPLVPGLLFVLILALALRFSRPGRRRQSLLSLLLLCGTLGTVWQIPALRAQLQNAFTDPQGETLPILVSPILSGADVAGFERADFSNASGVPLTISSVVSPTFNDCFPGGLNGVLLPGGGNGSNPPDNCSAGLVLTDGTACRVDVDSICRVRAEANVAQLSITGSPLTLTINGPTASMTVTNTSAQLTATGIASALTGTALAGNVSESGNTCAAVSPGASCSLAYSPGNSIVPPTDFTIGGDNTNTVWATIEIESRATLTAVDPDSGTASGGAGVTLTGTGLTGATGITFDGVAATSINVVNATTIAAVTPAHAAGVVDVVIDTPAGPATLPGGYTYLATAVGQASGGGIIAALDGGLGNLIATVADNSTAIAWGGLGTVIGAGAQSNTDGTGNSAAIVATLGNNGGVPYAAQLCNDHEVDSQGNTPCQAGNTCYNDWFLPATDQAAAVFNNRAAIGGFAAANYWSSTELSANPAFLALSTDFNSGSQFAAGKDNLLRVRCVRAFIP